MFTSLCSFICLQAVYQLSGARLLGIAALRILLQTFISRFVIDLLSIGKVIISPRSLPMIVTPGGHVLYTKMLQIAFPLYCATLGGGGGGGVVSGTQPLVFFSFLFRAYSIENKGLGNSFTFFVTFPGMLAVTAERIE